MKTELLQRVEISIRSIISIDKKPHILLGLSGGPDSVFLFHNLLKMHDADLIDLSAAHLNHEWRPEAEDDERFCKKLASKYNVPLIIERASNIPEHNKSNGSLEDLGRRMRQHFFEETKNALRCDYVALAHHADDQLETFFIRLARGTTLKGLCCIQPRNGFYIRPMLSLSKYEILEFLETNRISYCIDKTNEGTSHLRGRIRNKLIPLLENIDARLPSKILDTVEHLHAECVLLQQVVEETTKTIFPHGIENSGDLAEFKALDGAMQKRILISVIENSHAKINPSNALLLEILRFLNSPRGGNHTINSSLSVSKHGKVFSINTKAF
ncbi:tRNA lysidine(34) synthetase TilS [bacterium]|nr:tRNA lysidine(34) synthetase TilS [bacterium]